MGADRPPAELAAGALRAAEELPITLILVGPRAELPPPPEVEVVDPSAGESSIALGVAALAAGRADAFLSPGSTGAVVRAAVLGLGRLPGLLRPGLCVSLPTLRGEALLIDGGATADAKSAYLLQYADLGAAYARAVLGIPSPTVGLLNIGEEPGKGDRLTREAHELLSDRGDFIGNVEPHAILTERPADVIVAGGFAGNLLLKALEGGRRPSSPRRGAPWRAPSGPGWGLLARPALRAVARQLRYEEHNAAPSSGSGAWSQSPTAGPTPGRWRGPSAAPTGPAGPRWWPGSPPH